MNQSNSILPVEEPAVVSTPAQSAAVLTSGRLLAKNVVWNLLGTGAPILVAIVCLPVIKAKLGTDRLGIISLAWVVLGYFGFFDMGLSRALTKLVAERLGEQRDEEIPGLIWTSLFLMFGIGILGSVIAALLVPWMVLHPLKIPPELHSETIHAFYWIGIAIPIVPGGVAGVAWSLSRRLKWACRV